MTNEDIFRCLSKYTMLCDRDLRAAIENWKKELEEELYPLDLFLLSIEEYEKYKDRIPLVKEIWWLRSTGHNSISAANVNDDGAVNTHGNSVSNTYGIRPALRVDEYEISNLQIGDRKICYDFPFIKIDDDLLISEVPIAFDKFDDESNDYEKSYVKRFLKEWKESRV